MISIVHRIADSARILNAQVQLLGRAHVPLSVRLHGRVSVFGEGELILRYGVSLVGTVVPIELGTYDDGRVEGAYLHQLRLIDHSAIIGQDRSPLPPRSLHLHHGQRSARHHPAQ
jgi:hypothetical protein